MFVARFNIAILEVKDLDEVTAIVVMKWGLRNSKFTYSLNDIFLVQCRTPRACVEVHPHRGSHD